MTGVGVGAGVAVGRGVAGAGVAVGPGVMMGSLTVTLAAFIEEGCCGFTPQLNSANGPTRAARSGNER